MSNIAPSDSPSLRSVSRHQFLIEHVRIDSEKPYLETRTALEELPRFDERIRSHLLHGDIERAKAELNDIQGDAGVVIFSIATHGDWLQILLGKRNVVQYVIGNVLVSTQMTQHELAAGLYAPLRIVLYENRPGTSTFEYDRPSTLFGQYGNEDVTAVARELDRKIFETLISAAK
jgi:uncharacterized protein (DUF302 family)